MQGQELEKQHMPEINSKISQTKGASACGIRVQVLTEAGVQ